MQTFVPYGPLFHRNAQALDDRRLGKQRVEAWQIFLALTDRNYGWQHHPATKMWAGYEDALLMYGATMCSEWKRRGFQDELMYKFWFQYHRKYGVALTYQKPLQYFPTVSLPYWLTWAPMVDSHRKNLIRKHPDRYGLFGWDDTGCQSAKYVWPTKSPWQELFVTPPLKMTDHWYTALHDANWTGYDELRDMRGWA